MESKRKLATAAVNSTKKKTKTASTSSSHAIALEKFDCCETTIRSNARVFLVRCDANHSAKMHPRCVKKHQVCTMCNQPWTSMHKKGSKSTEFIPANSQLKSICTHKEIVKAANDLWNMCHSGTQSAAVYQFPAAVRSQQHIKSIINRLERRNFIADKYSMGNRCYDIDPDRLRAFCDTIQL